MFTVARERLWSRRRRGDPHDFFELGKCRQHGRGLCPGIGRPCALSRVVESAWGIAKARQRDMKFCFVIHPTSLEDVVRYEPGAVGKGRAIIEKILDWMPA